MRLSPQNAWVRRCSFTVSKPELKGRLISALETKNIDESLSGFAFNLNVRRFSWSANTPDELADVIAKLEQVQSDFNGGREAGAYTGPLFSSKLAPFVAQGAFGGCSGGIFWTGVEGF